MKFINPVVHGLLDYVVVIAFAASPTLFNLGGLGSAVAYLLAIVHLALTLTTISPVSMFKAVPLKLHGVIELIVGLGLIVLGFTVFPEDPASRAFYIVAGLIIFAVSLVTNYTNTTDTVPTTPTI